MAHAKWVMPRGACKIEQLGNDNTVIQYQGAVPPQMIQVQPNPPEVYTLRQEMKQELQILFGSHGISRGAIPKGITASSALQFLNELENERSTTDIAKHGFLIRDLAQMTIAVAGDYYSSDDGRLMRIVGRNNSYLIKAFDAAHLHKSYDIRVDLSTGVPEMKSAKIERTLEALQRNPTMLPPERWEELLDLGSEEKRITLTAAAIQAADAENEDMLAGEGVHPPERWEDHVLHWDSHVRFMQTRSFKESTPEVKEDFEEHLFITERAIIEKMQLNPLFQAQVAQLKLFPLFAHEEFTVPASAQQQEALVQGQANRGEQVSGNIPAQVQQEGIEQ